MMGGGPKFKGTKKSQLFPQRKKNGNKKVVLNLEELASPLKKGWGGPFQRS